MAHPIPRTEMTAGSNRWGLSWFWDFVLPLGVAGVPTALFLVLGWLTRGLEGPGGRGMPAWVIGSMIALQTAGTVAMALVAFLRYEMGVRQLHTLFPGGIAEWRRLCLFLGVVSLTLFDIIANVGAATRTGPMALAAIPFYLAYLLLIRIGLWRQVV
jgi:hypothetical protein